LPVHALATTSLALLDGKNTARALFIADETGSSTTRAISSLGAASSKEKTTDGWGRPSRIAAAEALPLRTDGRRAPRQGR
jgi:hypothetical protein